MRLVLVSVMIAFSLSGCAWVGMAAAGFVGTVGGNLVSDAMQGKNKPNSDPH
jgi:hypothetical protein